MQDAVDFWAGGCKSRPAFKCEGLRTCGRCSIDTTTVTGMVGLGRGHERRLGT